MDGTVCNVSSHRNAFLGTEIGKWMGQSIALSEACEKGSAEAMREGKVCQAGILKVAEPSSELRRALERPITGAGHGKSLPCAPRSLLRRPG